MLLPKDPNDDKNIFLEMGGAGGDESALSLSSSSGCTRFAELHRWKVEVMSISPSGPNGLKGHRLHRGQEA
jgi:peptide chain release factor 1